MAKKTDTIVTPTDASPEDVARKLIKPATPNHLQSNEIERSKTAKPATQKQTLLDLDIELQRDINGIEMGVLENGIAFLTQNGLAEVVGVARSVIFDIKNDWEEAYQNGVFSKGRITFIQERLMADGYNEPTLYVSFTKDGTVHYAYPDVVCMAILEYYAYEAQTTSPKASDNFRNFARYGLQKFIYESLGYKRFDSWRYYHDRVSLLQDASPEGFFIVFKEISSMVVDLISAGLTVNDKTIPDISVGMAWGKYWFENNLETQFGDRKHYEHNYPSYYSQSSSNPQKPWAYPDVALPEFRRWFKSEYLLTKFPKYILNKAKLLKGGRDEAEQIAGMYTPKQIEE